MINGLQYLLHVPLEPCNFYLKCPCVKQIIYELFEVVMLREQTDQSKNKFLIDDMQKIDL